MNRNDPTEASVPTARNTATPRIPRRLAICASPGSAEADLGRGKPDDAGEYSTEQT
jgi:hypothetical protein